jgi:hypothetical protein
MTEASGAMASPSPILVVIAHALLIAILVPALGKARTHSSAAACVQPAPVPVRPHLRQRLPRRPPAQRPPVEPPPRMTASST